MCAHVDARIRMDCMEEIAHHFLLILDRRLPLIVRMCTVANLTLMIYLWIFEGDRECVQHNEVTAPGKTSPIW